MCLFQVQHKLTSLHIPFYCFKGSFDRSLNVPVSPGCLVQRIFEDCICVSLFSYQGSHLRTVLRQLVYYITFKTLCQQLFKINFQKVFFKYSILSDNSLRLSYIFDLVKLYFRFFQQFCGWLLSMLSQATASLEYHWFECMSTTFLFFFHFTSIFVFSPALYTQYTPILYCFLELLPRLLLVTSNSLLLSNDFWTF